MIEPFQAHPRIHWVEGQAYNLMPDGSRKSFAPLISPGYVKPETINDYYLAHTKMPLLPAGLTVRTTTARALGGWVATPYGEDTDC